MFGFNVMIDPAVHFTSLESPIPRRTLQIVFVITLTDNLSSEDRDRDNKTLYKTEKVKAIKRKKLYVIALADDLRCSSPCFAIRT